MTVRNIVTIAAFALAGCMTEPPLPPPPPSGDVYVALGTEPFWRLTINSSEIVFTEANAPGRQIAQPAPRPIIGVAGEIYQTPRINVNIVPQRMLAPTTTSAAVNCSPMRYGPGVTALHKTFITRSKSS